MITNKTRILLYTLTIILIFTIEFQDKDWTVHGQIPLDPPPPPPSMGGEVICPNQNSTDFIGIGGNTTGPDGNIITTSGGGGGGNPPPRVLKPASTAHAGTCDVDPYFIYSDNNCWTIESGHRTWCPITCSEEVRIELPNSSDIVPAWHLDRHVKAGQTFVWGVGDLEAGEANVVARVHIEQRCRHDNYNWGLWFGEFNSVQTDYRQAHANFIEAEDRYFEIGGYFVEDTEVEMPNPDDWLGLPIVSVAPRISLRGNWNDGLIWQLIRGDIGVNPLYNQFRGFSISRTISLYTSGEAVEVGGGTLYGENGAGATCSINSDNYEDCGEYCDPTGLSDPEHSACLAINSCRNCVRRRKAAKDEINARNKAIDAYLEELEIQRGIMQHNCSEMKRLEERQWQLIRQIRGCENRSLIYIYLGSLSLEFEEPRNETYRNTRDGFVISSELITPANRMITESPIRDDCKDEEVPIYYCDKYERECKEVERVRVPNCADVPANSPNEFGSIGQTWLFEKTYDHVYHPGGDRFVWWTLKSNGALLNSEERAALGSIPDEFFYRIGYALPTAIALQDGIYEIAITGTGFGDRGRFTFEREGRLPDVDWRCYYIVDNDIFGYECEYDFEDPDGRRTGGSPGYCKPYLTASRNGYDTFGTMLGLDVVYRVVSLTNVPPNINDASAVQNSINIVFPGRDAGGRRRGQNWTTVRDVSDADIVQIMRNTVRAEGRPMYEIMLTVEVMQGIRRDNQNVEGDPYVPWSGTGRMVCRSRENSVGETNQVGYTYCASDFLTRLAKSGEFSQTQLLRGTCMTHASGTDLGTAARALRPECNGSFRNFNGEWVVR